VTAANGLQVGYIETRTGLIEVNYFDYLLYSAGPEVSRSGVQKMQLTSSKVIASNPKDEQKDATASLIGVGRNWPQNSVTPVDSDGVRPDFGVFCVSYSGAFDTDGSPQLVLSYGTRLPQPLPTGADVTRSTSALADFVLVRPGHAALARDVSSGASQDSGHSYLVTDTGIRYEMTPPVTIPPQAPGAQPTKASAAKQLRYDAVPVTKVPDNWMQLIQTGAALDPSVAGATPPLSSQ
jgi:hypothetical protein